ncbi:hypothetical protein KFE25_010311 [Diacronema lutheri]|uniref:Calmodulin n=1 Tax=Diacronema lutheri TaxID=2081491 RepID=A0A8J6C912_DIALT|nr:hypothetical protein KFE25_010311 [Diacronema lutheri]
MPGVPDCTQILNLSEGTVVDNLKARYDADEIHTYVGSMLVVLNPYKLLPIYDDKHMGTFAGVRLTQASPHVFALAEEAYLALQRDLTSQSIVISGESGAGKTESAKHMVRYISWRARKDPSAPMAKLADALVRENPSLEAFGNASTTRNANSSRFAKFVRLHIGSDGQLARVLVATYLLEKARVTSHVPGDRNFHIFYQLCACVADGAPSADARRKELRLPANAKPDAFTYLRPSAGSKPAGAAPVAAGGALELEATVSVLGAAGIAAYQSSGVLRIICAVLQLGNVAFGPAAGGSESSAPADARSLDAPQALLGMVDIAPLLLERRLTVAGMHEQLVIALTPAQCAGARDALARSLYELVFIWIVRAINRGLGGADATDGRATSELPFIGMLDVFGFEDFETNGFEQLCINFTNERLQQFLVERIFKAEARLYVEEGVPQPGATSGAQFVDNAGCVDMIGGAPSGIFRLLDSQCISPQATDAKFVASVNETHLPSVFLRPPTRRDGKAALRDDVFKIRHYAGDVVYSRMGFVGKNSDALDSHVAKALSATTDAFLKELLALGKERDDGAAKPTAKGRAATGGRGAASGGSGSLSRRFAAELESLINTLSAGGAHFCRCIAPSGQGGIAAKPKAFDRPAVVTQLKADGTFDAIRLMKSGYPVRVPFASLHTKFLPLLKDVSPEVAGLSATQFAELLAAVVGVRQEDAMLGSTRIFLRGSAAVAFDELRARPAKEVLPILKAKMAEWEAKDRAMQKLRPRLFGWTVRHGYHKKRNAAIVVQSRVRGIKARERRANLQEEAAEKRRARRATQRLSKAGPEGTPPRAKRRSMMAALDEEGMQDAEESLGELAQYVLARGSTIDEDGEATLRSSVADKAALQAGHAMRTEQFQHMRATLASRDYAMLEHELSALVARARAEEEAQSIVGRGALIGHALAEYAETDDDEPERRVLLRDCVWPWDAQVGSQEVVVIEDGLAIPIYRRVLRRAELLRLRKVFDEWDTDHDGSISLPEFFVVMRNLKRQKAIAKKRQLPDDPPAKVEAMFEAADVDGSGRLNFPEFILFTYTYEGLHKSTYRSIKKGVTKRLVKAKAISNTVANAAKKVFNPLEA